MANINNRFNRLPPKPEHLQGVLGFLESVELATPQEISRESGISLTAVTGALEQLEKEGRIRVIKQNASPKLRVGLLVQKGNLNAEENS